MVVHIHRTAFHPGQSQPEPKKKKAKTAEKKSAVIFRDRSGERHGKTHPVKAAKPPEPAPAGDVVAVIREAMRTSKVLTFKYMDQAGALTARTVEPYKLMRSAVGEIVLYGYCLEKDGIRLFKTAVMRDCRVDTYPFSARYPLEDLLDT